MGPRWWLWYNSCLVSWKFGWPTHRFISASGWATWKMPTVLVHGGLVVSILDCQSRGLGFKSRRGIEICASSQFSYDEYIDRTLSVGRWNGEGEDWPSPSYAEAKKMMSLTLHTHGCYSASFRDCSALHLQFSGCYILPMRCDWSHSNI